MKGGSKTVDLLNLHIREGSECAGTRNHSGSVVLLLFLKEKEDAHFILLKD